MSSLFKTNADSNKTDAMAATTKAPTTIAFESKTSTSTASNRSFGVQKRAQESQPLPEQQQQQSPQAPQPKQGHPQGGEDVSGFVRSLLDEMQGRFEAMHKQMVSKIDSVGSKVDALDAEITELMREAGVCDVKSEQEQDSWQMGQAGAGYEPEPMKVGKAPAGMLGHETTSE
ncbi:heat shock factor-binding protein 1-like [Nannochloropsis oceanica]